MNKCVVFPALFLICFLVTEVVAQGPPVPDSVLSEIVKKRFIISDSTYEYMVYYPENIDTSRKYPVVFGLAGGRATEYTVGYCYWLWFRCNSLNDHIIILPILPKPIMRIGSAMVCCRTMPPRHCVVM